MQLVTTFRARVVDVAPDSLIIEATGTEDKVDGLLAVLRPFGVLEMVRTGRVALARGQQSVATEATGGAPADAPDDNVSHSV
jgi:acetolactate synthase-1/3 small subunit